MGFDFFRLVLMKVSCWLSNGHFPHRFQLLKDHTEQVKHETILNIVANILIQNKTVAILSNNNSAVSNVYEKMDKQQLGYVVALTGEYGEQATVFQRRFRVLRKSYLTHRLQMRLMMYFNK